MDDALAALDYCYLTTTGRRTGDPHRVEIWFAAAPGADTIYLLAGTGARADWIQNLRADPRCTVEIGELVYAGRGRSAHDAVEDRAARDLVYDKYATTNRDLETWRDSALLIALELSRA